MIKLGAKVKDKVTGFTGIATSKVEYLNGCVQFCVVPRVKQKDNKMPDGVYVDIQQLERVGKGVVIEKKDEPGGAMLNTPPTGYTTHGR